jgi:hypothetical protein
VEKNVENVDSAHQCDLEEQLPLLPLAYRPPTHEDARQDGVPESATFACNLLSQESCCAHPSPSNADVKNMWDYTAMPPYVFKMWCLMKNRENLTFPTFTYERSINYDRKNIVT